MKRLWLLLLLFPVCSFAQSKRIEYINQWKDVAIREMQLYNIPASITLAQGILESGDGQSTLAKKANNHFGIKCHKGWTGGKVYHDDDKKGECFRKYKHAEESFRDHSAFLTSRSRYAALFDLDRTDYKGWAKGLKKAGYATSPTYANSLIDLIERWELHQYDLEGLGDELLPEERILAMANGAKYVTLEDGETLEDISKLYKRCLDKILDYNDLTYESTVKPGDKIYIRKKKKKGSSKYYKVLAGETAHEIAQKNGIRLKWIYKRNKKQVGWQPKAGETIRLRGRVK